MKRGWCFTLHGSRKQSVLTATVDFPRNSLACETMRRAVQDEGYGLITDQGAERSQLAIIEILAAVFSVSD